MAAFTLVTDTDTDDGSESIYIVAPDSETEGEAVDAVDIATLHYDGRCYIATLADDVGGMEPGVVYVVGAAQETVQEETEPDGDADSDAYDDGDDDADDTLDIEEEETVP